MKKQIKYCLLGLFTCLLLNIIAMRISSSPQLFHEKAEISYFFSPNDANENTIRLLYTYSNPFRKAIAVDTQYYFLKSNSRLSADIDCKNKQQLSLLTEKVRHPYLHPDGIVYYVYTLEKIVI